MRYDDSEGTRQDKTGVPSSRRGEPRALHCRHGMRRFPCLAVSNSEHGLEPKRYLAMTVREWMPHQVDLVRALISPKRSHQAKEGILWRLRHRLGREACRSRRSRHVVCDAADAGDGGGGGG